MDLIRQCTAKLAIGSVKGIGDVNVFPWRWVDVPRRYALKLAADGKLVADFVAMTPNTTKTLTLPNNYTAGKRLRCAFRSNDVARLVVVSPDQGTSTILLKGTNGTTNGAHDGYLVFTGTITSISLQAPSQNAADVQVEYVLYELPDITQSAAFAGGTFAFGSVP